MTHVRGIRKTGPSLYAVERGGGLPPLLLPRREALDFVKRAREAGQDAHARKVE